MTLHDRIMNLPTGSGMPHKNPERSIYKTGHRDARHAAAELSLEAEELMSEMAEALVIMDWFFVDDGSERKRKIMEMQKKVISAYNTYKERKQ